MQIPYLTEGLCVIGGALIGAGVTYLVVTKRYERILEKEIRQVKDHYAAQQAKRNEEVKEAIRVANENVKKGVREVSQERANEEDLEALAKRLQDHGYKPDDLLDSQSDEERVEVLESMAIDLEEDAFVDIEDVQPPRERQEHAFVISRQEYDETEGRHDKVTLYYYVVDDILVGSDEQIVDDVEYVVGNDALTSFGRDSGDRNIVFVRNDRISTDFEVIRDPRSYSETVLGFRPPKSRPPRMRKDD